MSGYLGLEGKRALVTGGTKGVADWQVFGISEPRVRFFAHWVHEFVSHLSGASFVPTFPRLTKTTWL